jgi:hypothetical protein
MPQQVVTINGRTVYSSKRMSGLLDGVVRFTDGSWINVLTGEKYVRGNDDIVVDPPFSDASSIEKTTVGPVEYSAQNLSISDVANSAIVVKSHKSDKIFVTVSGNKDEVDGIIVRKDGNTVTIEGKRGNQSSGGINISNGNIQISGSGSRGNFMSIGGISIGGLNLHGNNIMIMGGGNSEPLATITVLVPENANVSLQGNWHSADIGNINGDLTVSATGNGDVQAGKVKNASISISGSSDVTIEYLNGDAMISTMGSGDVQIGGGKANSLVVKTMGSGDVTIRAEAVNASLSSMGSSDIYVRSVVNRPSKSSLGTGSIKVGNW